jgi:ABC-type transport system involved in cytochrome c biogenesis permease component
MRPLAILFRKELHATFTSPIAYTMATVFLLVLGYTFSLTLFATKIANLNYIFHQIYVLSILLVPVLTMRAFAEERRTDTLELLLTAPVREIWIVLAKFLAALSLMTLMFGGSLAYAVVLGLYGDPDWGPIYSGYLAIVLNASLLISLGLLMSSLTEPSRCRGSVARYVPDAVVCRFGGLPVAAAVRPDPRGGLHTFGGSAEHRARPAAAGSADLLLPETGPRRARRRDNCAAVGPAQSAA